MGRDTYAGQLIVRAPQAEVPDESPSMPGSGVPAMTAEPAPVAADYQEVDVNSLQLTQPRSVGVEHVGLHALKQLGLIEKLRELGLNGAMRAAIIGNLIGRLAQPAPERSTWRWLQTQSALGELIDVDYAVMSHMSLYRASDALMRHRSALEEHLFGTIQTLFGLEQTVTLYDLIKPYFEGAAEANPKARHSRSKEKRSDCPLVTLGLVLDGSGHFDKLRTCFIHRSMSFAGNVSEETTLKLM